MLAGALGVWWSVAESAPGCPPIFAEPAEGACLAAQIAKRQLTATVLLPAIVALIAGSVTLLRAERRLTVTG